MMKTKYLIILVVVYTVNLGYTNAQYADNDLAIIISANYTTTAKLYLTPNVSDPLIRGSHSTLKGVVHYGVELRYKVDDPFLLGLNIEYYKKTGAMSEVVGIRTFATYVASADNGFTLIPVELSAYYVLPFSSDKFKLFMGGGLGIYFGNHVRTVEGVGVSNLSREFAYGIQVNIGMEYCIDNMFSINGGMKFKDPEFKVKSKYNEDVFVHKGEKIMFRDDTFDSKVNIDGVTFYLGIGIGFDIF